MGGGAGAPHAYASVPRPFGRNAPTLSYPPNTHPFHARTHRSTHVHAYTYTPANPLPRATPSNTTPTPACSGKPTTHPQPACLSASQPACLPNCLPASYLPASLPASSLSTSHGRHYGKYEFGSDTSRRALMNL